MAATYLDITILPKSTLFGVQFVFRVTARNADASVDTGYVGTVSFSCAGDASAILPTAYTFVGGDAGTQLFKAKLSTLGAQVIQASAAGVLTASGRTAVFPKPPGWGLDDEALLPYGDGASGISSSLRSAKVFSTREVDVAVTFNVQDDGPFLPGDALNPETWSLQRLDTAAFLTVVGVTQVGSLTYRLQTYQEFGDAAVTHRVSTSTLLDPDGNLIGTPRNVSFLGILDAGISSTTAKLATRKVASTDFANATVLSSPYFGGTLQLTKAGDYQTESGASLVRKLILRRLTTRPGDFFHLPSYGLGLKLKEPVPLADLAKLKTSIEAQVLREPEVDRAQATLQLDAAKRVVFVSIKAVMKKTGEQVEVGLSANDAAVSL